MKIRGFEKVSEFKEDAKLPVRATKRSAGYDIFAQDDIVIPSFIRQMNDVNAIIDNLLMIEDQVIESTNDEQIKKLVKEIIDLNNEESKDINIFSRSKMSNELKTKYDEIRDLALFSVQMSYYEELREVNHLLKPTLVPTGVKAYMQDDEYLEIVNRSSSPLKRSLMISNGVGVIDSDYYNNIVNEGHIMVQVINFGVEDITIKKGERIAQGIFKKFLLTDDDENIEKVDREGGFGSTTDFCGI